MKRNSLYLPYWASMKESVEDALRPDYPTIAFRLARQSFVRWYNPPVPNVDWLTAGIHQSPGMVGGIGVYCRAKSMGAAGRLVEPRLYAAAQRRRLELDGRLRQSGEPFRSSFERSDWYMCVGWQADWAMPDGQAVVFGQTATAIRLLIEFLSTVARDEGMARHATQERQRFDASIMQQASLAGT